MLPPDGLPPLLNRERRGSLQRGVMWSMANAERAVEHSTALGYADVALALQQVYGDLTRIQAEVRALNAKAVAS